MVGASLPNTLNVSFVGQIGSAILASLGGVAASTGSACHAGSVDLSPVPRAMDVPPEEGASYRRRKMLANRTASTASVIAV